MMENMAIVADVDSSSGNYRTERILQLGCIEKRNSGTQRTVFTKAATGYRSADRPQSSVAATLVSALAFCPRPSLERLRL